MMWQTPPIMSMPSVLPPGTVSSRKKMKWTEQEDEILVHAHRRYGNRWEEIAQLLPGRSMQAVRKYFSLSKKRPNSVVGKYALSLDEPPAYRITNTDGMEWDIT